ncbi:hypothetical protein [Sandaracinus amylolyticus]|uniref:hypothetical protein n=1 Tax=Sandaracinus amylolyticus TaxID=927083 RepID=UPI001F447565|nr:hypothetical protein [Sandaracinus amylolyticus]
MSARLLGPRVRPPNDHPQLRVDLELGASRARPGERPPIFANVRNLGDDGLWVASGDPHAEREAARLSGIALRVSSGSAHQHTTFEPARFWVPPHGSYRTRVLWAEEPDALPRWMPGPHTIDLHYCGPGSDRCTWTEPVTWELVDDGSAPDRGGVLAYVLLTLFVDLDARRPPSGSLAVRNRELRPVVLPRWVEVEWELGRNEWVTTHVILAEEVEVPSLGEARVGPFALVPPEGSHPLRVRVVIGAVRSAPTWVCRGHAAWPDCGSPAR